MVWILLFVLPWVIAQEEVTTRNPNRPQIFCQAGSVTMKAKMESGDPHYIFVRGYFKKEGCSFSNTSDITIDFHNCGVSKKREVNPRGLTYSLTVAVQRHPVLTTKGDSTYHVNCFYQEMDKSVGAELGVSDLAPTSLHEDATVPQCLYTLHKESPNGPLIKMSVLGESIYHVWTCESEVYGMLLHTCVALDKQGDQHMVIDENGCSVDSTLFPDPTYSQDTTKAFSAVNAFNFPDQVTLYFTCQTLLCHKTDGGCKGITPPRCGNAAVGNNNDENLENDLDNDQLITTPASTTTIGVGRDDTIGATSSFTIGSHNTTTRAESSTTVPVTSTTTSPSTTTLVTTTVIELSSSTTNVPTTIVLPKDFPTPNGLRSFLEKKYSDASKEQELEVEGSGIEITRTEMPTPVSLILGNNGISDDDMTKGTTAKREVRRRDTIDRVEVDLRSPELTIVDKEFATEMPEALKSSSPQDPSPGHAVCIPLLGFWLLGALAVLCFSIILAALCYAQKQRNKFHMMH